ncbi:hypothetical protein Gorai_023369, partial [Gossypium raimondii]|nr:hypothetical protein [Gossypium raimondii]
MHAKMLLSLDVDIARYMQYSKRFGTGCVICKYVCSWWWAPSKFDPIKSPMLFFERGLPLIPPIPPDVGFDKVLKHT